MFVSEKSTAGGIVLGMVVLIVLMSWFAMMMNKRQTNSKGAVTTEAQITEGNEILENLRSQIEKNQARTRDELTPRLAQDSELRDLTASVTKQRDQLLDLKQRSATASTEVAQLSTESRAYRDKYRNQVRKGAIGEKIPTLTTKSGKTFLNAEISDVSAQGMTIRHEAGLNRLRPADLDAKWNERFQWAAEEINTPDATASQNVNTPVPPKKIADVR